MVIPFGVPKEGQGLGLGLAALIHSFGTLSGQSVALAQLLSRAHDDRQDKPGGPVEALLAPQAWRDMAGVGQAPKSVDVVITGGFEPPNEGHGSLEVLAFAAEDLSYRARIEATVDPDRAGADIVNALTEIFTKLGGELGVLRDIAPLDWDALESVLLAERCALTDPTRGGPHDRLAALVHLGRAVEAAPSVKFPAGRLAALALDVTLSAPDDAKLAEAALRALVRATEDAPEHLELFEARAALHLRMGDAAASLRCVDHALADAPDYARLHALRSEALRAQGNLDAAWSAISRGVDVAPDDPVVCTERGIVLAERGQLALAEEAWKAVLDRHPLYPAAYSNLAALATRTGQKILAERLVDLALASVGAHPDVLRRAMHLSLSTEDDDVARAARVSKLATDLIARVPNDAWATLMLARACVRLGETERAAQALLDVERMAPETAFASEAQRGRLALRDPVAAQAIEALVRAAFSADLADLAVLSTRGRELAAEHAGWVAWYAVGIAERRAEHWHFAREAFLRAIEASPGCTPSHMELVGVCVKLDDAASALRHAERAIELEGQTAATLAILATALLAAGRRDDARVAIDRSLELDATDPAHQALRDRIRGTVPPPSRPLIRLRDVFARWRKR